MAIQIPLFQLPHWGKEKKAKHKDLEKEESCEPEGLIAMAQLSQKSQKTTRITTNLHFAEQLHPKPTVFSLCWVQGLLQIHVAMHRSEAKPMPSPIWAPTKTSATAFSQLSYCKAQLAASEKGLNVGFAKLKCPLFPEEESISSKQSNWRGEFADSSAKLQQQPPALRNNPETAKHESSTKRA